MNKPKDASLIDEYFKYYNEYANKYGYDKTLILIQVGGFYEMYQTTIDGYNLQRISDILNIMVSKKNKSIKEISNKNPYMLGFPLVSLHKFLKILIDNNFTVVVIEQNIENNVIKRTISGIYSTGTYIEDINTESKNILSIFIECVNIKYDNYVIGLSVLDLTTGKSTIHEIFSIENDKYVCFDETIRFMHSFNSKEIVIYFQNIDIEKQKELIIYLELTNKNYYIEKNENTKNMLKISYQQELLKKIYNVNNNLTPIEYLNLEKNNYGRMSFIILLNYVYNHVNNIINNLNKPIIYDNKKYLHLGNNAIYQLNIISHEKNTANSYYTLGSLYLVA
jgi:DNA mismatch repair protein MutS